MNDDFLVAYLDIGHAEMEGLNSSSVQIIKALGTKLHALHIHNNDKRHDLHQIPFSMDIDFCEIVKALKIMNYSGYLALEADRFLNSYTSENITEGIGQLAATAKNLPICLIKLKEYKDGSFRHKLPSL